MLTVGWVLFLNQVYPYHLREVLNCAHLFRTQLSDLDYELLDDYFGSTAEIRSRPSAKFLEIWPRYLELLSQRADDVRRGIDPELPSEVVDEVWIPALKHMIAAAQQNQFVVWISVSLVVRGEPCHNGPTNQSVLIRELNRNLSGSMRARAKQMLNFEPIVPDYLKSLVKTYNVICSLLNNRPEYLDFDPKNTEKEKPDHE